MRWRERILEAQGLLPEGLNSEADSQVSHAEALLAAGGDHGPAHTALQRVRDVAAANFASQFQAETGAKIGSLAAAKTATRWMIGLGCTLLGPLIAAI